LKKKLSDYKVTNPMPPEESIKIKSIIMDSIMKENMGADTKQINDELFKMYKEGIISQEIYEWAFSEIQRKDKKMEQSSISRCDTPLIQYNPIELDDDDLYHASLCSKVVCESTDTKECSQLLQSSSRRSLQAVSMTELLEDPVIFPKCMIALFSDGSEKKTCFVAFEDFAFQKLLKCYSGVAHCKTFGAG
jgi:uncharacterized protein YqgQ